MMDLPGHFNEALIAAVLETFENLAFMEPESTPGGEFMADRALCCSLAIQAPLKNRMQITMGEGLGKHIAGTIWSLPRESVDDQMCRDVLAELLNTIAGRFMKALLPGDQTFQLGLPEVAEPLAAEEEGWRHFPFSLDTEVFVLSLRA